MWIGIYYWLLSSLVVVAQAADLLFSSRLESKIFWPSDGRSTRRILETTLHRSCKWKIKGKEKDSSCFFKNIFQCFNLRFINWNSTLFRSTEPKSGTKTFQSCSGERITRAQLSITVREWFHEEWLKWRCSRSIQWKKGWKWMRKCGRTVN